MTNLQSPTKDELSSAEAHPFEGRSPGPGAALATVVRPAEVAGHVMSQEIDLVRCLHEQLARCRAYSEYLGQAPQVVSVAVQCLVDRQNNGVAELLAELVLDTRKAGDSARAHPPVCGASGDSRP